MMDLDEAKWLRPLDGEPREGEVSDDLQFDSLKVLQRRGEYCFSSDAALLANFAKARPRERVVELCAGSGVISVIMAAKTRAEEIVEVELNPQVADRAARTVFLNGLHDRIRVWNGDVKEAPACLGTFDVVVANPPYYPVGIGEMPQDEGIAMSRFETKLTLAELVDSASRLLRYGGRLYVIHRAERLAEVLDQLRDKGIEPKTLYVVSPLASAPSDVVLIEGKRGGKTGMVVKSFVREELQRLWYRADKE